MINKACIACLALTFPFSSNAEEAFIAPLVKESTLLDITATDYVVAVGERGHILVSSDGVNFVQSVVPTDATLTAVSVIGDNVWAVGHDATILHSGDRGKSWDIQFQAPEMERPFLDVYFFDENQGVAIGAYGLFYRTLDGGNSWQPERHQTLLDPMDQEYLNDIRKEDEDFYLQELESILPHLNRINVYNGVSYIAGEAGLLARSDDQGRTWQRYTLDYIGSFFDIQSVGDDTLVAVGLRGKIFTKHLDDDGWMFVNTCDTTTLNSIIQANQQRIVAVGNNGREVVLSRPLITQDYDPYGAATQCTPAEDVVVRQKKDKSAILNAVSFNGEIIAVTADGIQQLNLD